MRIQIYVAIITYCLVAIIEHDLKLNRDIYQVIRILGSSLLTKDTIKEIFFQEEVRDRNEDEFRQLELDFD